MCIGVVAIAERNVGQTFQDMLVHTKTILDGSCVVIMWAWWACEPKCEYHWKTGYSNHSLVVKDHPHAASIFSHQLHSRGASRRSMGQARVIYYSRHYKSNSPVPQMGWDCPRVPSRMYTSAEGHVEWGMVTSGLSSSYFTVSNNIQQGMMKYETNKSYHVQANWPSLPTSFCIVVYTYNQATPFFCVCGFYQQQNNICTTNWYSNWVGNTSLTLNKLLTVLLGWWTIVYKYTLLTPKAIMKIQGWIEGGRRVGHEEREAMHGRRKRERDLLVCGSGDAWSMADDV